MIRLDDGQVTMVRSAMALGGEPQATRVGRGDVGRRRFLRRGGAAQRGGAMTSSGSRCSFTMPAVRRPARAPAAPGRTSMMPGAPPTSLGIPHYVLDFESRFRDTVIADFADSYLSGRDAGAVHHLQPDREIRRSARHGAGARAAALVTGHYAAIDPAGNGRRGRSIPLRHAARPELFPPCDHPEAARPAALSAWRHDQGGDPASWPSRSGSRWRTSRTARTSALSPTDAIATLS